MRYKKFRSCRVSVFPLIVITTLVSLLAVTAQEPALPSGLDGDESGTSENGDDTQTGSTEPALPSGLADSQNGSDDEEEAAMAGQEAAALDVFLANFSGFAELRAGTRLQSDPLQDDLTLAESRLQLGTDYSMGPVIMETTFDFLFDDRDHGDDVNLDTGEGWFDLRELNISFTPFPNMDVRAGRQILTWGTGDLIFINDMFPKDWQSFFLGRDSEYLKAPSDAIKVSFYGEGELPNLDIVYTPRFDADRYVEGSRLSFWNLMYNRKTGEADVIDVDRPDDWFDDDEIAFRLFENVRGYELAAYYYDGFWKSPAGMNQLTGEYAFPELAVYGASVRGEVAAGIGNLEIGYYDSKEDRSGKKAQIANSELQILAGYEQEVRKNLTAAAQYYVQYMQDYSEYENNLPPSSPKRDEFRHTVTLRLRQELMRENLILSLFSRYSPSDEDVYLRPQLSYKINDDWRVEVGADIFRGRNDHTFLGQFEDNSNIHAMLRCSF